MKKYAFIFILVLSFTSACKSTNNEETNNTQTTTNATAQAQTTFEQAIAEEIQQIDTFKKSDQYKKEWQHQDELWQDISLHIQQYYRSKHENTYIKPYVQRLEKHEDRIGHLWRELTFLEESDANLQKLGNDHYLNSVINHHKETTQILLNIKHQLNI